jgi:cytochrome c oxidase subunit 3
MPEAQQAARASFNHLNFNLPADNDQSVRGFSTGSLNLPIRQLALNQNAAIKKNPFHEFFRRELTTSSGVEMSSSLMNEDKEDKKTTTELANIAANPLAAAKRPYGTAAAGHHDADHGVHGHYHAVDHPFHVVPPSYWGPHAVWAAGNMLMSLGMYGCQLPYSGTILAINFGWVVYNITMWWRDLCIESAMGFHTDTVKDNMMRGMWLFILSEVMIFFAFLWGTIHVGMQPTVHVMMQWPPVGVHAPEWDKRALAMSVVLAASYFTANLAMTNKNMLWATLGLAALFVVDQGIEYCTAPFTFTDSAFGSTFYFVTGLHGLHVIVGAIFLGVAGLMKPVNVRNSVGMQASILYWHFVDLVWIAVYGIIYVGQY